MSKDKSGFKICNSCKEPLPLNEFTKDRSTPDGLKYVCKACRSISGQKYRKDNINLIAIYRSAYYLANKEVLTAQGLAYRFAHKDKINTRSKQYRENNKAKIAQKDKLYREKNKAELSAKKRIYWEKNKEQFKKKKKKHYGKNRERILESQKEYLKTHKTQRKAYMEENKIKFAAKAKHKGQAPAPYTEFVDKLSYAENTEKGPNDELVVLCAYCNKPFVPTRNAATQRADTLIGKKNGEHRFYCSQACRDACPSFGQKKHWKSQKPATSREVSAGFRQLVFERDNWTCQRCGVGIEAELHAHHIDGAVQHPGMSNDLENGITFCKSCHRLAHSQPGCRYVDLRCPTITS